MMSSRLGNVAYWAVSLLFAFAVGCGSSSEGDGTTGSGGSQTGGTVGTGGTGGTGGSGGTVAGSGGEGQGRGGSEGTGGVQATGGIVGQGGTTTKTGGVVGSGGTNPGGGRTGGAGRTGSTGGVVGSGGTSAPGGSTGAGTGGTTSPPGAEGPCDIYAAASTPCVAAYSMARPLSKSYSGPLYQVRKGGGSKNTGTGGTTQDIGVKDGYADSGAQDTFCGTDGCTVSILYDQSGKKNDLKVAPKGCYTGTASEADYESSATKKSYNINGHKVYGLYMNPHEGYRNNSCTGVPTKTTSDSVYVIADGKHAGSACCWDFGNTWGDNCNSHTMNPIFFGTGYWGKGAGSGPWFMGDFEGGVWAGGSGASNATNSSNPSMNVEFAFGMLKTSTGKYAIKAGNAQSGSLTTAYDGASPKTWDHGGAVLLGIGGDNSNSSNGTFYEGALVTGLPSNETDDAVFKNVQAAGFGK
jgi:non-reducing end alpha-L-arabinofuranosidase